MSEVSTAVARIVHEIDLTGKVLGFHVEPIGPLPTDEIAQASFLRALQLHPWINGSEPKSDRTARQIFLGQVGALCIVVNELLSRADFVRTPRPELNAGAIWHHDQLADYFKLLRERIADISPYLQKERQR